MLTDNEIKEALECCGDEGEMHWCTGCPYYDKENDFCQEDLHRDVLDLINRRDAEIERLEGILGKRCEKCPAAPTAYKEFAERLWINACKTLDTDTLYWLREIRNQTLKELTEVSDNAR